MKLELATQQDNEILSKWSLAKLEAGYDLPTDFRPDAILKVANHFYVPSKHVLFLGPLIPNPDIEGKRLALALVRLKKDLQAQFPGDIMYMNLEENGVDKLARSQGFEGLAGTVMVLPGKR